jgi:beta-glucanase (GH16 family)
MKKIFLLVSAHTLCAFSINAQITKAARNLYKKEGYRLVWADEFNKNGKPDSANWGYEHGFVRNEEDQWYQPDNAWCENGNLIIEARKETKSNPDYEEGSRSWRKNRKKISYTSSCLITAKKKTWTYGRFEMRGRIDIRSSMWPAWWTLGVEKKWPANGEIDIMEYYRGMLLANLVTLGRGDKQEWRSKRYSTDSLGGEKWASQFHTWIMDWSADSIVLSIDGHVLNKIITDSVMDKDGSNFNPFKQPHYMLLNLAIGGQNGGNPSNTSFPGRFEIDYVRVYQKQ